MALVLLHPIGLDGRTWQFLTLPPDLPWIGYTLLGHGDRRRPPSTLDIAAFADDLLRHTGGPLDLVGVSMGGAVAQAAALREPQRVRSLMLVASTAGGRGGATHRERAEAAEKLGMAGVADSHLRRWFSPDVVAAGTNPGYRYARDALLRGDPDSFAASWRALGGHDTLAELPRITVPTTVLHPEQDASASVDAKERMVAALPNARLVLAPGPHMIQLEQPGVFTAAILQHLNWAGESG